MSLQNHAKIGSDPVLFFDNGSIGSIELLTIAETADFLKISVSSMRRLQSERHVPFLKVGGGIRFLKSDILAFLTKRRVEAIGK